MKQDGLVKRTCPKDGSKLHRQSRSGIAVTVQVPNKKVKPDKDGVQPMESVRIIGHGIFYTCRKCGYNEPRDQRDTGQQYKAVIQKQ